MKNKVLQNLADRTSDLLKNKDGLSALLAKSESKAETIESPQSPLVEKVKTLLRMIGAHMTGTYRSFSPKTLFMLVFGLVYFITPTDLIPDFLPAVGFVDDLSVLVWIFRNVKSDIQEFEEWESSQALEIEGEA